MFENHNIAIGETRRFQCNDCQNRTHHQLKATHRKMTEWLALDTMEPIDDDYEGDDGYIEYRLWGCMGCDTCCLEVFYNEGEPRVPKGYFYPPRQKYGITEQDFYGLPRHLHTIYQEVVLSFNYHMNLSCAIGLRALLEGVCEDKGITGRTLKARIDRLTDILPDSIVTPLHTFRFMGNEAVHRLEPPPHYMLRLCIGIMESLLDYLYELERKLRSLPKEDTPPSQPPDKSSD